VDVLRAVVLGDEADGVINGGLGGGFGDGEGSELLLLFLFYEALLVLSL
jgi:hypothetical protein